jgi:hypothetical protein
MKIYVGSRQEDGREVVTVDGQPLDPRFDLVMCSPSGFAWGYGGSGPAQLAIAILADCVGPAEAQRFYHEFKWQVIAVLEIDRPWSLTEDEVRAWVARAKHQRDRSAWIAAAEADRDDHPIED